MHLTITNFVCIMYSRIICEFLKLINDFDQKGLSVMVVFVKGAVVDNCLGGRHFENRRDHIPEECDDNFEYISLRI